jgi:hypothetical protein
MAIKAVRLYDNGFRLALLKQGTKWQYYVTLELPLRVRRTKLGHLEYKVVDGIKGGLARMLDSKGLQWGTTNSVSNMVAAALKEVK